MFDKSDVFLIAKKGNFHVNIYISRAVYVVVYFGECHKKLLENDNLVIFILVLKQFHFSMSLVCNAIYIKPWGEIREMLIKLESNGCSALLKSQLLM